MRKYILILLMSVVSGNAMAKWEYVSGDTEQSYYIDPFSIHKTSGLVKTWVLFDSKNGSTGNVFHRLYYSAKIYIAIRCNDGRINMIKTIQFSEPMGNGKIVFTNDYDTPVWISVSPVTMLGMVVQTVCDKK